MSICMSICKSVKYIYEYMQESVKYCIVGNFCGTKFLQMASKMNICG